MNHKLYGISFLGLLITTMCFLFPSDILFAQDVGVGITTTYDQNIFDTYSPLKDQITQLNLNLSNGWDSENTFLGVFYSGTLSLYKDLTARNYNLHTAMAGISHHFQRKNIETKVFEDSTETEDDSTSDAEAIEDSRSDSLDNYLNGTIIGASQFNKIDFEEWDNTLVAGTATFRQPLGLLASIRPSYTLSYHSYPNLSLLTNIQNIFSLHLGSDIVEGSWIMLSSSYAIKNYPISSTTADTIGSSNLFKATAGPGNSGNHGNSGNKGNKGGKVIPGKQGGANQKIIPLNLKTPSTKQLLLSLLWNFKPAPATEFTTQFTHFSTPSTAARVAPELFNGSAKNKFAGEEITTQQNEISDDHFSYTGNELTIHVRQLLPIELILSMTGNYQDKKYTYPAKDLADSVIAAHRLDYRSEIEFDLSRIYAIGNEKNIKAQVEYHYLINKSNAPYFDFKKNTFLIGLEYNF